MKKIWILSVAAAAALALSACGVGDVGSSSSVRSAASSQAASSQAPSSAAAVTADSVADSLSGLQSYLVANASVTGTPETMRADMIGAKSGVKYKFGYNGGKDNVTLELYQYDPSSLNETAQKVLSEVRNSGRFTLLEKDVEATLSDSGKYLAIVTDSSTDDANRAYVQKVKNLVKGFKAG